MATLKVTWHSRHDQNTCETCLALDGFTWTFVIGMDELGDALVHPEFGMVWNTMAGSSAHNKFERENCRCWLTFEYDLRDMLARVKELRDTLVNAIGSEEESAVGVETET